MDPDLNTAQLHLNQALQALKKGDRPLARRLAQQAAALAPDSEEPWLLLVYLSPAKAAQYYLSRAVQVNPAGPRVLAAQEWMKQRSGQAAAAAKSAQTGDAAVIGKTLPRAAAERRKSFSFLWLIVLVLVAGLAFLGLSRLAGGRGLALFGVDPSTPVPSSTLTSTPLPTFTATAVPTSTYTPVPTATSTATPLPTDTATPLPTDTPTPLPTDTATPLPTETSTPMAEPTNTQEPSPTPVKSTPLVNSKYTVQRGDTLGKIAQRFSVSIQALIDANTILNPSYIYAGQVLNIPKPGTYTTASQPTEVPVSVGSGKNKEIVIDISEQHMWAYEDKQLVFSFVVSTGTGNSTRIGTFKVLDKIPNAYSSRFNIWMPYWLGIYWSGTLENGIHGLPLLWNGVELWGSLLGKPATYGCIEARTTEIKQLYNWAEIGTPVIIRN